MADLSGHERDARVLALLWRLPPELWREPRAPSLPASLQRQLDAMDAADMRRLLVELLYRLEATTDTPPPTHS